MKNGASCGILGRCAGPTRASPLKKVSWMKRSEYATLNTPASVAPNGSSHSITPCPLTATVSAKNISFDRKPLSSGTPAMAALATMPAWR
jgi:hypothetical protein